MMRYLYGYIDASDGFWRANTELVILAILVGNIHYLEHNANLASSTIT